MYGVGVSRVGGSARRVGDSRLNTIIRKLCSLRSSLERHTPDKIPPPPYQLPLISTRPPTKLLNAPSPEDKYYEK